MNHINPKRGIPRESEIYAAGMIRGLAGPLGAAAAKSGSDDFSTMWAGQAAALGREMPAGELVMTLMDEASAVLKGLRA